MTFAQDITVKNVESEAIQLCTPTEAAQTKVKADNSQDAVPILSKERLRALFPLRSPPQSSCRTPTPTPTLDTFPSSTTTLLDPYSEPDVALDLQKLHDRLLILDLSSEDTEHCNFAWDHTDSDDEDFLWVKGRRATGVSDAVTFKSSIKKLQEDDTSNTKAASRPHLYSAPRRPGDGRGQAASCLSLSDAPSFRGSFRPEVMDDFLREIAQWGRGAD
ncbi:hypothetical protein K439DRAFT_1615112 [Ramaria rubella]|nr:hypothetical protein K439DRAFT_1615112 [Ramaria rubella]